MKLRQALISENALCLFLLFLAAILVAHPLLFQGKIPIGGNGLSGLAPWEDGQTATNTEAPAVSDLEFARYYASFRFLSDTVRSGGSLLWDPGRQAGVPFLAQWWTRCLSPFSLPFYVFGTQGAYAISTLLKLLTAGWLAYYVARVLGLTRSFALLVGLSHQLGGFLLLSLHHPVSDVMPWVPLLFLYAERLAIGQGRYWPVGALVGGLTLLSGDPIAAIAAFLFFACYFLARIWKRSAQVPVLAPIVSGIVSATLALGLAATQLLPAIEWWAYSSPVARPMPPLPNIAHLIGLILPNWEGPAPGPGLERSLGLFFIGPVQLLLACLWLALRNYAPQAHRRRIDSLLGISTAMIFVTLLLATASENVPAMARIFRPEHFLVACPFAFALACAAAAEAWLHLKPAQCAFALKRFIGFSIIALVCVGAALAIGPYAGLSPKPEFTSHAITLTLTSLLLLALIAITLLKPNAKVLGYGLAAITAAQSYAIFTPMVSFSTQEKLYPQTEFIMALEDAGSQVGGSPAVAQWPLGVNGIATFYGTGDRALNGYLAFVKQIEDDPGLVRSTSSQALLLTHQDLRGPYRELRPTLRMKRVFAPGVALFECLDCEQMAVAGAHARNTAGTLHPANTSTSRSTIMAARKDAPGPSTASLDTNTRLTLRLRGDENNLLLAHAYYPGWRAFIDGHEENLYPVDGFFMGMRVPKGSRTVVFSYEPQPVFWGRVISIATGVLVLLGLANLFYFRLYDTYFRS